MTLDRIVSRAALGITLVAAVLVVVSHVVRVACVPLLTSATGCE